MQAIHCKPPRLVFLAGYLLVTTAGGLFHVHGTKHGAAAGGAGVCSAHLLPSRGGVAVSGHTAGHGILFERPAGERRLHCAGSECCPICQFLAQKLISTGPVQAAGAARAHQESAFVAPVPRLKDVPWTFHSRAPPVLA